VRPFAFTQIVSLALLAILSQAAPASAQGFFGWFGGQDDRYPRQNSWSGGQRQYVPPQANAYADPYGQQAPEQSSPAPSGGTGRSVAYCVRLCDGRYFPMQRHGNATSIQLCNAFCPAAKTQVFNGSAIDHAAASNGARYANLENAFVYREKIVPNCTCNGKDPFGLAQIDAKSDPTLRPGDIVATGDNQKAALVAAANRQARNAVTKDAALRGGLARSKASDADDPPED
jgi:hypothetical protein